MSDAAGWTEGKPFDRVGPSGREHLSGKVAAIKDGDMSSSLELYGRKEYTLLLFMRPRPGKEKGGAGGGGNRLILWPRVRSRPAGSESPSHEPSNPRTRSHYT